MREWIHTRLRPIVNNDYVFTIFTKGVAMLIGLIATGLSSRYLGPALKGQLAPISNWITLVAVIANLGLYQPYPFYRRQGEPDVLAKFLNIFSLQFVVYTAVGIVAAVVFRSYTVTAVCLIAPIQVLANQLSFLIMVEDVKYKNVVFFTARVVNTVIMALALLTLRPSLLVALALIVVGDLITVGMALRRLKQPGNPLRASLPFLRKITGFGVISMITTLLLTLNYRIDVLMLDWFRVPDTEIGFYQTGISLAEYCWLIPEAFREVLFSRTARSDAIDDVSLSLKLNLYLTLAMILGVVVLGKPLIRLVHGAPFLPAYNVTVILLAGIVSMSYFKLIGTLLMAQGKQRVYLVLLAASVLVNILANWLTIPTMGKEGAALASVLSYTVAGGAFLAYFVRTYHVPLAPLFVVRRAELRALWGRLRRKPSQGGAST